MSDAMVMRYSGWTFSFDGRALTLARRGTPWRPRRVEHLPLGRLRACHLRHSESHGIESHAFWLVYDTDTVLLGVSRQFYEADAYWFAKYLSEAICERLRRIFQHTIGLGPHPEAELLRIVRPALGLDPYTYSMGDIPRRLTALRKDDELEGGHRIPGPTRPSDFQINHHHALRHVPPNFESWWTFVEHVRAGYEPVDEPGWEEVVQDLRRGREFMDISNPRYSRSGHPRL